MSHYLGTIICAALGIFLLAGGAVLLWLHSWTLGAQLSLAGAVFYAAAITLTARPRL